MTKLKRVSFPIAKAIKEAGYPQEGGLWYNKNGVEFSYTEDYSECYARPTYIEVGLWLWREKKLHIYHDNICDLCRICDENNNDYNNNIIYSENYSDPEEAIIAAINHLVTNNLIK